MPSIPPPPPPAIDDDELTEPWPSEVDTVDVAQFKDLATDEEVPYGIALYDFFTDHPDDLCFTVSSNFMNDSSKECRF